MRNTACRRARKHNAQTNTEHPAILRMLERESLRALSWLVFHAQRFTH